MPRLVAAGETLSVTTEVTKEIVLELDNKPGTLGELASRLGKESINILGFTTVAQGPKGVAHIITSDPALAGTTLKAAGYRAQTRNVLLVAIPDEPGQLGQIASTLGNEGISIDASFVTTSPATGEICCAICVADVAVAQQALGGISS